MEMSMMQKNTKNKEFLIFPEAKTGYTTENSINAKPTTPKAIKNVKY